MKKKFIRAVKEMGEEYSGTYDLYDKDDYKFYVGEIKEAATSTKGSYNIEFMLSGNPLADYYYMRHTDLKPKRYKKRK